jgi:glycosyl transferase family 25
MTTKAGEALLATFERVRIINLKSRADRRREASEEFARLGLAIDGDRIAFHEACRPNDPGGFQTIGTRGCFFSHLQVLELALNDGVGNILILEDDLDFSHNVESLIPVALDKLAEHPWGIFYGGLLACSNPSERAVAAPLWRASPDNGVLGAHFLALSKAAIHLAVPYLKAMAERAPGSPEGGSMHVDGAYSWLRKAYPNIETWLATPELGHQRPSRTDIHDLRFIDRAPVMRDMTEFVRRLKRRFL